MYEAAPSEAFQLIVTDFIPPCVAVTLVGDVKVTFLEEEFVIDFIFGSEIKSFWQLKKSVAEKIAATLKKIAAKTFLCAFFINILRKNITEF